MGEVKTFDIEKPLWDLSTFYGRWRHFGWVTDPRSCFAEEQELEDAKKIYFSYKYVDFVLFIITVTMKNFLCHFVFYF